MSEVSLQRLALHAPGDSARHCRDLCWDPPICVGTPPPPPTASPSIDIFQHGQGWCGFRKQGSFDHLLFLITSPCLAHSMGACMVKGS